MSAVVWVVIGVVVGLVLSLLCLLVYDLLQSRHALLRTYPVIGRARFLLEKIGPEMRQYWFLHDKEERPFNRTQRNWVYQTAKGVQNTFGFGTEIEPDTSQNYLVIKHVPFPHPAPSKGEVSGPPHFHLPSAKVLGEHRGRRHAFRPSSAVNVSAMSFGSLSGPAVESMNRGAALAGCLQNTGEGGLSRHHKHGGELIFQIGSGYFGCRDEEGRFSLAELERQIEIAPIRALEIKLSQGAKPGLGGLLPAAKVTDEIAEAREVSADEDCVSPSRHSAFGNVDEMLDFVEMTRRACPSGSSRRWERTRSGPSSRTGWRPRTEASTSSRSTEVRAVPGPRRSSSPITWRSPSRWVSRGSIRRSRARASPTA